MPRGIQGMGGGGIRVGALARPPGGPIRPPARPRLPGFSFFRTGEKQRQKRKKKAYGPATHQQLLCCLLFCALVSALVSPARAGRTCWPMRSLPITYTRARTPGQGHTSERIEASIELACSYSPGYCAAVAADLLPIIGAYCMCWYSSSPFSPYNM